MKKSSRPWDRSIILLHSVISGILFVIPGFDAVRFQWSSVPVYLSIIGFTATALCLTLLFIIMKTNPFLTPVVEIQHDHNHFVVTTGPYRFVRHPMYSTVIVMLLSLPLALGSLYAFIPSAAMVVIIVMRTILEDRTLKKELNGYIEYAEKTPYRLIPGLW